MAEGCRCRLQPVAASVAEPVVGRVLGSRSPCRPVPPVLITYPPNARQFCRMLRQSNLNAVHALTVAWALQLQLRVGVEPISPATCVSKRSNPSLDVG